MSLSSNFQIFNLVSADGTALKGRFWKPGKEPWAVLILVHGIGEHSGRYHQWAQQFTQQQILVYALDYRGHGLSAGNRGHINNISEWLDDIGALVKRVRRHHAVLPVFIYGHSMGGNLVLNFLVKRHQNFAGAVITSPWLELVKYPAAWKLSFGKLANKFFPSLTLSTGIKSSGLTSIYENQEAADKDVLMHGKITIRTFFELEKGAREIMDHAGEISVPLLICHGDADPITRHEASLALSKANPTLFTFLSYPGALHELHSEPSAGALFHDIINWIKSVDKGLKR